MLDAGCSEQPPASIQHPVSSIPLVVSQTDDTQQAQPKKRGLVRRKPAPPPESQPAQPAPTPAEQPSAAPGAAPAAAKPATKPAETPAPLSAPAATTAAKPETAPEHEPHQMSGEARQVPLDRKGFRPDPGYASHVYDAAAQRQIYGGKQRLDPPRPLLELGYPMYDEGELGKTHEWLGTKNPVRNQFLVYGDLRAAGALVDPDVGPLNAKGDTQHGVVASRLNLDFDWKLTGTERIHWLMRPLDRNGKFTRYEFKGASTADGKDSEFDKNGNLVTAFFEGDLGSIAAGMSGHYNGLDLPFAVGLIPLFYQNGVWLDDAFTGAAFTIPASNSKSLDISNMDWTFFGAGEKVSSPVFKLANGEPDEHHAKLVGVTTFIERKGGYIEGGYGYVLDSQSPAPGANKRSFHDATIAYTRRYGGWLSNSVRVVGSFGQEAQPTVATQANGAVLLIENSLITSHEATLVPYFNLFWGIDHPQSLARDPGAGGILKNTGINFETDGLTGYPTLDATATRAGGGALGLEYLFDLDQQLVFEVAGLKRTAIPASEPAVGGKKTSDFGAGLRYQVPFWKRFIIRADAMTGVLNSGSANPSSAPGGKNQISGVRLELRMKF